MCENRSLRVWLPFNQKIFTFNLANASAYFSMNLSAIYLNFNSKSFIPVASMAFSSMSSWNLLATLHGWHWQWYHIVYLLLAGQTAAVIWKFWWKAPVI